jgi:peroxiredoxin Q/BCP
VPGAEQRIPLPPKETKSAPIAAPAAPTTKVAAPGGSLRATDGTTVDLASTYAEQPVIVVFYRGDWCRQCRKQLTELQGEYASMLQRGVHLYAVSVDPVNRNKKLAAELKLGFPVLSDAGGNVARAWGVLDESVGISRPATFVVAPGGTIEYRHVGKDTNDRAHTTVVVDKAASLVKPTD